MLRKDLIDHSVDIQDHAGAEVVHIAAPVREIISVLRKDPAQDCDEWLNGRHFLVRDLARWAHDLLQPRTVQRCIIGDPFLFNGSLYRVVQTSDLSNLAVGFAAQPDCEFNR